MMNQSRRDLGADGEIDAPTARLAFAGELKFWRAGSAVFGHRDAVTAGEKA